MLAREPYHDWLTVVDNKGEGGQFPPEIRRASEAFDETVFGSETRRNGGTTGTYSNLSLLARAPEKD